MSVRWFARPGAVGGPKGEGYQPPINARARRRELHGLGARYLRFAGLVGRPHFAESERYSAALGPGILPPGSCPVVVWYGRQPARFLETHEFGSRWPRTPAVALRGFAFALRASPRAVSEGYVLSHTQRFEIASTVARLLTPTEWGYPPAILLFVAFVGGFLRLVPRISLLTSEAQIGVRTDR